MRGVIFELSLIGLVHQDWHMERHQGKNNIVGSGKHKRLCSTGERGVCRREIGNKDKNIGPGNKTEEYIMGIHLYSSNVFKQGTNQMKSL